MQRNSYHTSADNLAFIKRENLLKSYSVIVKSIGATEKRGGPQHDIAAAQQPRRRQ